MSAITVLLALSPIIWLIVALSILKLPAWQATSVAAIGSFIIAITAFQADPFIMVTGALEGAALAICLDYLLCFYLRDSWYKYKNGGDGNGYVVSTAVIQEGFSY